MNYESYMFETAFRGHRHFEALPRKLPVIEGGEGIAVDSDPSGVVAIGSPVVIERRIIEVPTPTPAAPVPIVLPAPVPPDPPDPPLACERYPWPDPEGDVGGPYYLPDDLPATVLYNGITLSLGVSMGGNPYYYSGGGYEIMAETLSGFVGNWALTTSGGAYALSGNLTGTYAGFDSEGGEWVASVFDQFLNSYSGSDGPFVLGFTRDGCAWRFTTEEGAEYLLSYGQAPGEPYRWAIKRTTSEIDVFFVKLDPQSSPVGTYSDPDAGDIVIS